MLRSLEGAATPTTFRLDARMRVIITLMLIIGIGLLPVVSVTQPVTVSLAFALTEGLLVGWMRVNGLHPAAPMRRAGLVLPFTLAAGTLLFTTPGHSLGALPVTDAGLLRFLTIVLKAWLSAQAALTLTLTTPFLDLMAALHSLGIPRVFIVIIQLTYRYIDVLGDEARRLMRARASRSASCGGRAGGSLLWRAQVTGYMVGSLFLRSYERAERIQQAMAARGYRGEVMAVLLPPLEGREAMWALLPLILLVAIQLIARL
jgi:cobalt/nickel transport system permease protein